LHGSIIRVCDKFRWQNMVFESWLT
jgi:hypothetical protein